MTRRRTRLPSSACALALAGAALIGCSPTPEPTPTATPAFASEEEAFAAAEETYRAYNDALNRVDISDPRTFEPLYALSSGSFEKADRENFSTLHAERHRIAGDAVVLSFVGRDVGPGFESVTATVCLDVSDVSVTNLEGVSVVNPNRPDVYAIEVALVDHSGQLLIDASSRAKDEACVAF